MKYPFNGQQGLVLLYAELRGPSGSALLPMALDTGATHTVINESIAREIGLEPNAALQVRVATASQNELASPVIVPCIRALGQERRAFTAVCLNLPPSTGVEGVLGLDFMRGQALTIDFRLGQIELS